MCPLPGIISKFGAAPTPPPAVQVIQCCGNLSTLSAAGTLSTDEVAASALASLRNLATLRLGGTRVTGEFVSLLTAPGGGEGSKGCRPPWRQLVAVNLQTIQLPRDALKLESTGGSVRAFFGSPTSPSGRPSRWLRGRVALKSDA